MALNEPDKSLLDRLAPFAAPLEPRYLEEPRGRFHGQAAALLKPRNVAEVSEILSACNAARVGVVPYGGGTGLVSGQIFEGTPAPVLLSLERMNAIRDVDPADNMLVAEAGAILADVRAAAENADRLFPLSLASEGSCRIGGNLATNAGGVNVLRYGNARDLCLGIEAVLADGTVFNGLKRLRKDNTGYDLRNLLVGSEGTLGIITAASLKLFPRPVDVEGAFIAVPSPQAALDLLHLLAERFGPMISAFELIHRNGLDFLRETGLSCSEPLAGAPEWMVLVECGAGAGSNLRDRLEDALAQAFDRALLSDAVLAQNAAQLAAFWNIRETLPEGNRLIGSVSSHDVSVPVSRVPEFITAGIAAIRAIDPALRINCFGHLGDGNLHYNVFPPAGTGREVYEPVKGAVKTAIHDLVDSFGGSFSAEHGVGRLKKHDLLKYGDAGKIAAMRAIKAALDPNGILNPGAVL